MPDQVEDRVALVDMDGTIVDYDNPMKTKMTLLESPGEATIEHQPSYFGRDVPPYLEARRKLIQGQAGFWRNLPRLELGFEVVAILRSLKFSLHILTKGPAKTTSAWSEKVEWCQAEIPDALVTVTQDKSLVYGRVLVDDFPPYFEKWLLVRPRGIVIAVAHPWNAHITHPNVVRYDGSEEAAAKVRTALSHAYTRSPGRQEA